MDEIIDVLDAVSMNLNDKKAMCRMDNYYILLSFLIVKHIAVNSCYYLLLLHKIPLKTKRYIVVLMII